MVKMSRMMPPTPVAAPWNGSTALGWLCDSILKAMARPSPMSMMPAFSSPAPTRMLGDLVGKVFSNGRRVFVGAMLAPHDGEDAELGVVGLAAEDALDALEFLRREAVLL